MSAVLGIDGLPLYWVGLFDVKGVELTAPGYMRCPLLAGESDVKFPAATSRWGIIKWWGIFNGVTCCPPVTTFDFSREYDVRSGDCLFVCGVREKLCL